jgi:CDP-glucose 4,6-dehydratase
LDIVPKIWQGKRVLVTGHTGFKGSWLAFLLNELGANVVGLSLADSDFGNSLYKEAHIQNFLSDEYWIDIRNEQKVDEVIQKSGAEYVFHLAAQAFVNRSVADPLESISTNVIGTANILISSLRINSLKGITVVTSDKVYQNLGSNLPFKESDILGGKDPYSASKAASELILNCLTLTCNPYNIPISSARAGNVLGGGDWGEGRLVPDLVKSIISNQILFIRNPNATRPWQHILDCLKGYLLIGQSHINKTPDLPKSFNFGPSKSLTVTELISHFEIYFGRKFRYRMASSNEYESTELNLDSSLAIEYLGWHPQFSPIESIKQTAKWYLEYIAGAAPKDLMLTEITNYRKGKW